MERVQSIANAISDQTNCIRIGYVKKRSENRLKFAYSIANSASSWTPQSDGGVPVAQFLSFPLSLVRIEAWYAAKLVRCVEAAPEQRQRKGQAQFKYATCHQTGWPHRTN